MHQTLAVDLDNTIAGAYDWPSIGEPEPGAAESLGRLRAEGFSIVVHTCRPEEQHPMIRAWLRRNGIPYDRLATKAEGKPQAFRYIDDKGVGYAGDWRAVEERVLADWREEMAEGEVFASLAPLSARTVRGDGYGGVDVDHWQGDGVVEPDHVTLPGTAVPHEPRDPQMPAKRKRWMRSRAR